MRLNIFVYLAVSVSLVTGDANSDLRALENDYYQWRLKDSPELATYLQVNTWNNLLDQFGLNRFTSIKTKVDDFLVQLDKIDYSQLQQSQKYSYNVFNDTLTTVSDGYQWRLYGALNPINFLNGDQVSVEWLIKVTPFETKLDFENFTARLKAFPTMIEQKIGLFKLAVHLGRTEHMVSIDRVPGQIDKILVNDPVQCVLYKPFNDSLDMLQISDAEKADLRAGGRASVLSALFGFMKLRDYITKEYMPHTRGTFGVGGWNQGGNYYQKCLQWHLSVDLTPGQVHQTGLKEVSRIRAEMQKIMRRQGFGGSIGGYFKMLNSEPRFHLNTSEELLQAYRDIIYNRIYPRLPQLFKNVPALRVNVTTMPSDGPPGRYLQGTEDGSRPGEFQVNVMHVKELDTYIMMGIALHEAIPGHHLQHIYKMTADLPEFRKKSLGGDFGSVPFSYPSYSAYVEGWALYAEFLGEELGLYKDDYELMGRYSGEIFRAGRLVVDTGIHYFGWTRNQSIQYFLEYSAFGKDQIEIEVDRYITWPGQACAYKIGELKIKELRKRAEQTLGARFDIKDFHEVLLKNGAVPLSLLEILVDNWIQSVLNPQHISVTPYGQPRSTSRPPHLTLSQTPNKSPSSTPDPAIIPVGR